MRIGADGIENVVASFPPAAFTVTHVCRLSKQSCGTTDTHVHQGRNARNWRRVYDINYIRNSSFLSRLIQWIEDDRSTPLPAIHAEIKLERLQRQGSMAGRQASKAACTG